MCWLTYAGSTYYEGITDVYADFCPVVGNPCDALTWAPIHLTSSARRVPRIKGLADEPHFGLDGGAGNANPMVERPQPGERGRPCLLGRQRGAGLVGQDQGLDLGGDGGREREASQAGVERVLRCHLR